MSTKITRMMKPCMLQERSARCGLKTSTRESFPLHTSLLHEFLCDKMKKNHQRTAFVDYSTKKTVTHGQIGEYIGKVANWLVELGVQPGDHVALSSFNHLNYFTTAYGIMAAGGTVALCNPGYTVRETEQLFKKSSISRVVGHPKNNDLIKSVSKSLGLPDPIDITDIVADSEDYSSALPDVKMDTHDTCALFYSSGTTGFPKAVELTHYNLVNQCFVMEDAFAFDVNTVNNGFLPWSHIMGNIVGMHVLDKGATSIVLDGFDPVTFLGAIQDHKVSFSVVVPPIMVFLAKHPLVDNYDLSSLSDLVIGAAPLSQQLEEEVLKRLDNPKLILRQGFGMSECSASFYVTRGTSKPGSIGKLASSFEAKVVEADTGADCGPGQPGEILLRGPCVMKGYYDNPSANAESFTEDGFFKTGDVGYFDESEDFYIVDRIKELIKVKGFQVAPAELEALLLEHPLIADAAVIGVPDNRTGERPKAFVVARPGSGLSEADVVDFVTKHVSSYKVPSQVEFVDTIPKLASGKIQRKVLREAEEKKRNE